MAPNKKRKNKKDVDFQKVKLKVGRRLKRDVNETKAEFNSRKIILKEVKSYSDNPLIALSRHSDHISQHGKLSLLNHFNTALTAEIVKSLNKPILDSLSKFIVDHSAQVRTATFKCLKTCFNHLRQQHLQTKDFLQSLKPYLDCAYTHISKPISSDCHKFVEYLVNINDPQIFEPLMTIVLRRYESGNLSSAERSLAVKLRRCYVRHRQRQIVEASIKNEKIEPLVWTETNYLLDLDSPDVRDLEREVFLVSKEKNEDTVGRYLEVVLDENEFSPTDLKPIAGVKEFPPSFMLLTSLNEVRDSIFKGDAQLILLHFNR